MTTRRKKKQMERHPPESFFRVLREPYHLEANDSMVEYYERYRTDSDGVLEIGDIIYYKIIHAHVMILRDRPIIIAIIDNKIGAGLHETLADEDERVFEVTSIGMLSFRDGIPEWYSRTAYYALEPGDVEIGEYLRRL